MKYPRATKRAEGVYKFNLSVVHHLRMEDLAVCLIASRAETAALAARELSLADVLATTRDVITTIGLDTAWKNLLLPGNPYAYMADDVLRTLENKHCETLALPRTRPQLTTNPKPSRPPLIQEEYTWAKVVGEQKLREVK